MCDRNHFGLRKVTFQIVLWIEEEISSVSCCFRDESASDPKSTFLICCNTGNRNWLSPHVMLLNTFAKFTKHIKSTDFFFGKIYCGLSEVRKFILQFSKSNVLKLTPLQEYTKYNQKEQFSAFFPVFQLFCKNAAHPCNGLWGGGGLCCGKRYIKIRWIELMTCALHTQL